MSIDKAAKRAVYSPVAVLLHWLVVALLAAQWWLAESAEEALRQVDGLALLALHKSFGVTIFFIIVLRLVVRLMHPPPPSSITGWQAKAALYVHRLFYFLLLFMPVTGWLGSSASAYSVSWFGWWVLPDLVAANNDLKELLFVLHEWSWTLLCALVVLHIAAALYHQFAGEHRVLYRMLSPYGLMVVLGTGLAVAYVVQTSSQLAGDANGLKHDGLKVAESQSEELDGASLEDRELREWQTLKSRHAANLDAWYIDYARSEITFVAEQAGAPFEGRFNEWQTEIYLSSTAMGKQGLIRTKVDLSSVDTRDQERDETLQQDSFFSSALFPQATFLAFGFRPLLETTQEGGSVYRGQSTLYLKGISQPIQFDFSMELRDAEYELRGRASLDRLAFSVGTGEWLDTSWVGQIVEVSVRVVGSCRDCR